MPFFLKKNPHLRRHYVHEPRAEEDEEDGEGHPGKVLQSKVVSQVTVREKREKVQKCFA